MNVSEATRRWLSDPHGEPTWKCEACGEYRLDRDIDVYTVDVKSPQGWGLARSVCYCTDRPNCAEGAVLIPETLKAAAELLERDASE